MRNAVSWIGWALVELDMRLPDWFPLRTYPLGSALECWGSETR